MQQKKSNLKQKIVLLTMVPLLLVSVTISAVALFAMNRFGEEAIQSMQRHMMTQRQAELANYTAIARSAIRPFEAGGSKSRRADPETAKRVLRSIEYGEDGYIFAYDYRGNNLVHPKKPQLEGKNLLSLQDRNGVMVIKDLIGAAKSGGDTVSYLWDKPSAGREVTKLGYALAVDDWQWMIGTGLYIDDIEAAQVVLREALDGRRSDTVSLMLAISLSSVVVIGTLAGKLTLSEGTVAERQIRQLSRRTRDVQEAERSEISHYLKHTLLGQIDRIRISLGQACANSSATAAELCRSIRQANLNITSVAESVESLSARLRPSELDRNGLIAAIKTLADGVRKRTGASVTVQADLPKYRLPETVEIRLYRIVEELLDNIERHAEASVVNLRIRAVSGAFSISVKDNGRGVSDSALVDPAKTGLLNVRDQLDSLRGKFQMITAKNAGTFIKISVPLTAQSA